MNLRSTLSLITALALVGCSAAEPTQEQLDWQQAQRTNTIAGYKAFVDTHSDSEHREDAMLAAEAIRAHEVAANKVRAGWHKLEKGMPLEQVVELVGPIDEVSLEYFKDAQKLAREYGLNDSPGTLINESAAGVYKLVFDTDGKLMEWSWQ